MGAYVPVGDRTVRYREKGWTYDLAGKNNGTFDGTGTFTLDRHGLTLRGPGVYVLYDLKGAAIFTEKYAAKGEKIAV